MKSKSLLRNSAILGFALFALFFGAGNLIFPPTIGLESGSKWPIGFAAYFVADVGFAIVGIIAMLKADGDLDQVTGSIGKIPGIILNVSIIACIGPMLAIPRTAATSFEMGTYALFGNTLSGTIAMPVFSVVFFALVFLIAMNPSKVLSRIGSFLTPVLVIVLAILIIVGIVNPSATPVDSSASNIVQEGILNGYQTMDTLAALIFGIVVIQTIKGFGYTDAKSKRSSVLIAVVVSSLLLFAVYGGLAYLGASTGHLWSAKFISGRLSQAGLLTNIANATLGGGGAIALSTIVLFACLTTAIGLVSSCSEYFHHLSNEKLSYKGIGAAICIVSALICNVGLSEILSVSVPILLVVYPVAMFLTAASLFRKKGGRGGLACKIGAIVALLTSLCSVLCDTFGVSALSFIHLLPLDTFGFNWLVPTIIAALLGVAIEYIIGKGKTASDLEVVKEDSNDRD